MKIKLILSLFFLALIQISNAQNNSSEFLVRSTTGVAGSSETISSGNRVYIVQHSIGQASATGTFYGSNYISRQGFIQPITPRPLIISPQNPLRSNPLPIEPLVLNLSVAIYPNPFTESITLSFSEEVYGTVEVLVFDLAGRLVFSKNYGANKNIKVEFTNISMATYIIRINTDNKQFIKKIIKNQL